MPQNLTGNPASFVTQTAPAPGDARTAASVVGPLQNAADRAAHLKSRIEALETGVRKIRYYATIAALKASTDHVDSEIVLVKDRGVYRYDSASSATSDDVAIATPNDVGGNGRWIAQRINKNLLDPLSAANLGVSVLTPSYANCQSFTITPSLGDLVSLDVLVTGFIQAAASGDSIETYVNVAGPGGFTQDSEAVSLVQSTAGSSQIMVGHVTIPMVFAPLASGNHTITVKGRAIPTPTYAQLTYARYRALVVN